MIFMKIIKILPENITMGEIKENDRSHKLFRLRLGRSDINPTIAMVTIATQVPSGSLLCKLYGKYANTGTKMVHMTRTNDSMRFKAAWIGCLERNLKTL